MTLLNLTRLLAAAAIWGASFLFMRVISPELGPFLTAFLRVLIAGLFLWIIIRVFQRSKTKILDKKLFVAGIFSSALPFVFYAYAALNIPAAYSAIANATTPLWGAVLAGFLLKEKLTIAKIMALLLGITGVALIVKLGPVPITWSVILSIAACLSATLCYAWSGIFIKTNLSHFNSVEITAGTQLGAALFISPSLVFAPTSINWTVSLISLVCALAILCSAIAYLLYFKLLQEIGATKAMTVTFLTPLFTLLWSRIFLHETITLAMVLGGVCVLSATYLVVKK